MNTLPEIEAAADALPVDQQWELLKYLTTKLERPSCPAPSLGAKKSAHDQMKAFCGIVDSGLPDLGSNKEHINGLGK